MKGRSLTAALVGLAVLAVALATAFYAYGPRDARAFLQDEPPENSGVVTPMQKPAVARVEAPEPAALTITDAAYRTVASDYSAISREDFGYARQSVFDPAWASVRVYAPDGGGYHTVFLRKNGKSWNPDRSVFVGEYTERANLEPLLRPVPGDLTHQVFAAPSSGRGGAGEQAVSAIEKATAQKEWSVASERSKGSYHVVKVVNESRVLDTKVYLNGGTVSAIGKDLTSTEAPHFPERLIEQTEADGPTPASHGSSRAFVNGVEREKVEDGLSEARKAVKGYSGVAGFYVQDLEGGFSYGVRPDEEFFAASVIKVPVMVAVFRQVEQGKLSFDRTVTLREEDIAPGSGGLEYAGVGSEQSVEDLLGLMITRSDNTASNALVRLVGGERHVNEVSRSLGATDTVMRQKVSIERAAVPALDNQTTPRDMARMLEKIYSGEAAGNQSCAQMIELMQSTELETWLEDGIPSDAPVANKAGWLDSTFNDVGIVELDDHPYIVSIFTKYGKNDVYLGEDFLNGLSGDVYGIQSSDSLDQDKNNG